VPLQNSGQRSYGAQKSYSTFLRKLVRTLAWISRGTSSHNLSTNIRYTPPVPSVKSSSESMRITVIYRASSIEREGERKGGRAKGRENEEGTREKRVLREKKIHTISGPFHSVCATYSQRIKCRSKSVRVAVVYRASLLKTRK
jgi:hypothetical protein